MGGKYRNSIIYKKPLGRKEKDPIWKGGKTRIPKRSTERNNTTRLWGGRVHPDKKGKLRHHKSVLGKKTI